LVIASYWSAISLAQLAGAIATHADSRQEFAVIAVVLGVLSSPVLLLCAWAGGLPWAGVMLLFWLVPVTHCTLSLVCAAKPMPMYARAIARLKLGKYKEAEHEVIEQLEKREDDFDGWMMLAELYARQFGDLAEAERTIAWLCDQPSISSLQISIALHRLADWHLKLCDDPVGASRALDEICRRLPESHLAMMARLRRQQLPATRQEWVEQKTPKRIALPALTGDLDADSTVAGPRLTRSEAVRVAEDCVERLKRNPNDAASREKLARVLAEELGKAESGIEQLELLLGMPGQPEQKQAEWLSLSAAWHFRFLKDRTATTQILTRLVRERPQTPQAFSAQRWLSLLEMEERLGGTKPPSSTEGPAEAVSPLAS
jgi:hypothetical protein